jgi:ABC-2 type transport system permease protein
MLLLRQIAAIATKELKILGRDRPALGLLFLMPAFFILVMSFALEGVFEAGTRDRPLELLVVNEDRGELAARTIEAARQLPGLRLVERNGDAPLTPAAAEALIRSGNRHFALLFRPHYSDRLQGGGRPADPPAPLVLVADPAVNGQMQMMIRGMIAGVADRIRLAARLPGAVEKLAADLAEPGFGEEPPEADLAAIEALVSDPGQRPEPELAAPAGYRAERRPSATEQNVPAYAIFGVFFIVLTLAKSFLRERTDGTLARLRTAPLARPVFIAGKILPFYLVNLLQIALMFAVGAAVFGMTIGNGAAFLLVSLATAAAACGLGVLVAAVGRSEGQVDTLAVLLGIALAALGGLMVPAYVMPPALKALSRLTPQAWALAGYQDVIVRGLGVREVLPETAALLGFALLFGLIGLWRLRLD